MVFISVVYLIYGGVYLYPTSITDSYRNIELDLFILCLFVSKNVNWLIYRNKSELNCCRNSTF